MRKIIFVICIIFFTIKIFSQSYHSFIGSLVDSVKQQNISNNLKQFEQLGNKTPGSAALKNTLIWLENKFTDFGYTQLERDLFLYNNDSLYNLIVTKTGSRYPNKFIILCGHYDTYPGKGTNDNGSGISIILETARILKNIDLHYSVRFICFSAEESGLIGSSHYVQNHSSDSIILVFNIDEVGGRAGVVNNTIICERDESAPTFNNAASWAITDTLATLTQLYSSLNTIISHAYGSDYVPFQQAGFVITGFYEANRSPYVHTHQDLFINLDSVYVFKIAKAAVAATIYFARFSNNTLINDYSINNNDILIFPNPSNKKFSIQNLKNKPLKNITIINSFGTKIFNNFYQTDRITINCQEWQPGIYYIIFSDYNNVSKKIQIIK